MNLRFKSAVAGVATLALAGVGMVATAGAAAAYPAPGPTSASPTWAAGDTARNGEIWLYDSTGARITGGSDYNNLGSFFAGQTTAKTTGATLANLSIAFPDNTNAVPSTWFSAALQPSTAFSTSASAPTAVGPVIAKANWPAGTTPIADTRSGGTLSTATNYQNVFELRSANSGPGVSAGGKYWAVDIEFNPGTTAFDGLAAGEWRVLQQVNGTATTTTVANITNVQTAINTTGSATVTANITPSGAAGTVQFKVDGVNSGSPVTVSAGAATATLTGLTGSNAGTSHTVTADFTAAAPATYLVGYANSSDTTGKSFTVTYIPLVATTTNVALSQSTVTLGQDTLTATATVTPASGSAATGTVSFYLDGSSTANATGTVTAGSTGAVTINFSGLTGSSSPGTAHTIVATYTDGNTWAGSSSAASTFYVIASYNADVQNIQTSISAGTLVISTPYTSQSPLVLPAMTLNGSASEYSTSAAFTGVSVADTRPGNLAYTLSAIASNLTKSGVASPGANETINAQNVGLNISALTSTNATPNTFAGAQAVGTATTGQNFTGFNNAAASHVAAAATGSAGLGGSTPHVVLHANNGLGTTVTNGTLTITAPSNTLDGTYAGTITFSIIGS